MRQFLSFSCLFVQLATCKLMPKEQPVTENSKPAMENNSDFPRFLNDY